MKNHLNKRGRVSPIGVLILLLLLSSLFYKIALGYYAAKYTESAHGNSPAGTGVNRQGVSSFGYAVGNCIHCHEQHASIGGVEPSPTGGADKFLLFYSNNPTSQNNNFCFQCHQVITASVQHGGIPNLNYDYGSQFGGGTAKSNNIKDAFAFGPPGANPGSSHNLENLRDWWKGRSGGDWVTADTNACVVCHDPHYAQKNHNPYTVYKTAIRKPNHPSSTQNKLRNLWGDEANSDAGNEMMNEYTNKYQSPYRVGNVTYEPAGQLSPTDGSNMPNFNGFCLTCHDKEIPNARTDAPVGSRKLYAIDFKIAGDRHGKKAGWSSNLGGTVKSPYSEGRAGGYCLSCTDCHEPHGCPNPFLLRTCVNGTDGITVTATPAVGKYYNLCAACHNLTAHAMDPSNFNADADCYQNGACHFHGGIF